MVELDFNGCLVLLIIGFFLSAIFVRLLHGVVNKGFYLVDYAKSQLYPDGGQPGGKTTVKDIILGLVQANLPAINEGLKNWLGGGLKQLPKAK